VLKGLSVAYEGPAMKLMVQRPERENWSLTLEEVNPLLEKWGFREQASKNH